MCGINDRHDSHYNIHKIVLFIYDSDGIHFSLHKCDVLMKIFTVIKLILSPSQISWVGFIDVGGGQG